MLRLLERLRRRAVPEPKRSLNAHTPLSRLRALSLDTETTGLNPRRDRVVSISVIEIANLEIAKKPVIDLLVDPGVPIPPYVTNLHGIDSVRVAGAPDFSGVHEDLQRLFQDNVVVGHNVGFDLALMAAESRRRRLAWHVPTFLDTARLVAAIDPHRRHLDLGDLLRAYGIEPEGRRHHAADDARMAGELFIALARRLNGQGRGTLGSALVLQA